MGDFVKVSINTATQAKAKLTRGYMISVSIGEFQGQTSKMIGAWFGEAVDQAVEAVDKEIPGIDMGALNEVLRWLVDIWLQGTPLGLPLTVEYKQA
jgi:hypothetical protein